MSEQNKIQNEEELWDLLSSEPVTEPKAAKSEAKFHKTKAEKPAPVPQSKPEVKAEPTPAPMEAVKTEPKVKAQPVQKAEKSASGRKIDGFFAACMAGVAAVSVALTLLISSMMGGSSGAPAAGDPVDDETGSQVVAELEQENAELRAQLELQKQQVKDLQSDLMNLMGSEEYLATASTDPDDPNEILEDQVKALDTLAQIQDAYADFDREKLEELIPQMDEQLSYLPPDALANYYMILEYVEQPSNG